MSNSRKIWVVGLVQQIVGDKTTAEMVVDRLMEEGLLSIGYGDKDVDIVVQKFTDTFGTTKTTKYDRFAASRLVRSQNGNVQVIVGIIDLLGQRSTEKYAPVVNNLTQLEEKWVSIISFLRKTDSKGEVINV